MSILPPKRAVVVVRLTEADREVMVSRALAAGLTLSAFARRAMREYIHKSDQTSTALTPDQKKEYLKNLARAGLIPGSSTPSYLRSSDGTGGA